MISSPKTTTIFENNMTSLLEENNDLSKQYQKKTDKQHILDNPDTYIGSVENTDSNMWIFDETSGKITMKHIEYVPGLYKLFDEGIVNCRDHVMRMIQQSSISGAENNKNVSYIETFVEEDGTITFINDGNGIDVEKHPEYGIWIPEMVFGHLRTSTNYNKEEKRIVGGKNGFGFKLVLIWSTFGSIETVDHKRKLKYTQEFRNNLTDISEPIITPSKNSKPYTKVVFKPDYARFQIPAGLSQDMISLFKKRVYDIAAVTHSSVKKISYNNIILPVNNFQKYVDMYIGSKTESKRVYEISPDNRWEIVVTESPSHIFEQISFVNGICTFKGGKHVEYISGQIIRKLVEFVEKKKKVVVSNASVKEQLMIFIRCDIDNPSFDSQTKDFMNTPIPKFGTSFSISAAFIEKVAKMGIMEMACSLTEIKENRQAKKTDGTKTKHIRGIPKLIDANDAGTANSKNCILILCEGLSALSGIVSGLSKSDRNIIGIYPLKGKLLNVQGKKTQTISENQEICDIKKILGLEKGKQYNDIEEVHEKLRYSKIMILCDQDLDGSHIKGLCLNLIYSEWQSLFRISGFLSFMNTPILRAKKGNHTQVFYNEGEYQLWKKNMSPEETHKWNIKYFKGLGTSTATEFKEYFANKKIVDFVYSGPESELIFNKVFCQKEANERKVWLKKYDKDAFLDTSHQNIKYEDFINYELIHFSVYDNQRSIPNLVDGLKISQRKILFCAFKRKLVNEIKVAQLSGYVSEHSNYHHGEASLHSTTISMAQNFVGSNNINLLEPRGQFGSRLAGSDGAASERYIYTQLTPITRILFSEKDDKVLTYLSDDGLLVEPMFYVPLIPFVLVNGISGIGTGFSTNIPSYNPCQIIRYLKRKLLMDTSSFSPKEENEKKVEEFVPYYEGFSGSIIPVENNNTKFLIKGVYEKINEDTIKIKELPIGTWTMPYITFLEELVDGSTDTKGKKTPPLLKNFVSNSTENVVDIVIVFPKGKLQELEGIISHCGNTTINGIEKQLKLTTIVSTTNMHLFNKNSILTKYSRIEDIIDEFFEIRIEIYQKRKEFLLNELQQKLVKLSNRARYIQLNLDGTIDLRRKKTMEVEELLENLYFVKIEGDFKYLTKMTMDSVFQENVDAFLKEKEETEMELTTIQNTSEQQMWMIELDLLETQYNNYREKRSHTISSSNHPLPSEKTTKKIIKLTSTSTPTNIVKKTRKPPIKINVISQIPTTSSLPTTI